MKVVGCIKYTRKVNRRWYTETFDMVTVEDVHFPKNKNRLIPEWEGYINLYGRRLIATCYGDERSPPSDGKDWNVNDPAIKGEIRFSVSTKGFVPWFRTRFGRNPNIQEINEAIDGIRDDILSMAKERYEWIE